MDTDKKTNGTSSVNGKATNDANENGVSKRKTRGGQSQRKSYAEPESSGEDEPLVCGPMTFMLPFVSS